MLHKPLILVGHKGVGKTTLGAYLSIHFDCPHIDLDALLAKKWHYQTARDAYLHLGELAFREEESRMIMKLDVAPYILSVGGGSLDIGKNLTHLSSLGTICWIEEPLEEALSRFHQNPVPGIVKEQIDAKITQRHQLFQNLSCYRIQKSSLSAMLAQSTEILCGI